MTIVPLSLFLLPFLRAPNRIYQNLLAPMNQKKKTCGFRLYSGRPCSGDPWRPAVSHSGSPCSPCYGDPRWPAASASPWLRSSCSGDPRRPATSALAAPAPGTSDGQPHLLRCGGDPRRPDTPAPPTPSSAPAPPTPGGRPPLLRYDGDPGRPAAPARGWLRLGARRPNRSTLHGPAPGGEPVPRPAAQPLGPPVERRRKSSGV